MWYEAKVTDPPSTEPVTLAEAKAHLRVLDSDDDTLIGALITTAREHIEAYCAARFAEQTVEIKCDSFADLSHVPVAPVLQVVSIAYVATDGTGAVVPDTDYELRADGLDTAIVAGYGKVWPAIQSGSRITVTLEAGYETVPAPVKHAMLLHIGDAYENRENSKAEGWTALDTLLSNYRR